MNEGRILQLKQFLREDENDFFSLYALGMEYKEDQPELAVQYLEELRHKNPDYTALYYHLAELYIVLDKIPKAKTTYENGIDIISKTSDLHALKEIKNAYQNFQFEFE